MADTVKVQREAELAEMGPVSDRGDGGGLSEESRYNGAKDSCLPYGKPGSDSGSLRQRKGLLQIAMKVGRREVSDPLQLGG